MTQATVVRVDRLDFRFTPKPWAYADARRAEIDAHFAAKQRANPALWNGRVLVAHEYEVTGAVCRGAYLETDFASFDAWRDWGRPEAAITDSFSAAALQAADGAFLLGVMAAHTANAGQMYFPCGTPDQADIVGENVDLEHSARRELKEETGLDFDDLSADPGWLVVSTGQQNMHAKPIRSREPADALRARILRHLGSQRQPELSDIRIVRGLSDLDPAMPPFILAFFHHIWR